MATLFLMAQQLDWMHDHGGLAGMVERTTASSDALYGWAEKADHAFPYVSDPALRSLVIGNVDFVEDVDAAAVAAVLRANGVVDTEPYRKLGRNQLRIGMYPPSTPPTWRPSLAASTGWSSGSEAAAKVLGPSGRACSISSRAERRTRPDAPR